MANYFTYDSALGELTIAEDGGFITAVRFGCAEEKGENKASPLTDKAAEKIRDYLSGRAKDFSDVPLKPAGTPFQLAVWAELQKIPYGQTRGYGQIAAAAGKPLAARAAGGACNRNPIALIVPCHRVVGANGSLTGFAGGLAVKEFLLNLEKNNREG